MFGNEEEKMQQMLFFSLWYWNAELLLFCFWYIPAGLQSYVFHLKEIVSGGGRVPHNYPKAGVSNEELLGKDDLIRNVHLHLHLFEDSLCFFNFSHLEVAYV